MRNSSALLLAFIPFACNSQGTSKADVVVVENRGEQIDQYVVDVFQDDQRNLWFGTLEKGVAKYDGAELRYLSTKDGLPSDRVVDMAQDAQGTRWFATGHGLSRYDGTAFRNHTTDDGLCSNRMSSLLFVRKGTLWIGTWGGVCTFDGKRFAKFDVPRASVTTPINPDTKDWVTAIMEDRAGNIWFGIGGTGAVRYDGKEFKHITTDDGLLSNHVTEITEDKDGNIWFGTRVAEHDDPDPDKRHGKGGVNRMIGDSIIAFPGMAGFNDGDVYGIHRDKADNMWISTVKNGVYRWNGSTFEHFEVPVSVMSMRDDDKGNLWMGAAGGLYRIDPKGKVFNVTTHGPWE